MGLPPLLVVARIYYLRGLPSPTKFASLLNVSLFYFCLPYFIIIIFFYIFIVKYSNPLLRTE